MRPERGLEEALRQRSILMDAMPTAEAFRRATSCSTWATWTGRQRSI
jgi:hypothetical protein